MTHTTLPLIVPHWISHSDANSILAPLYQRNRGSPKAGFARGRIHPARPPSPRPTARTRLTHSARLLAVIFKLGIEQMVLPDAIDAKILAGKTFPPEPCLLQQPNR